MGRSNSASSPLLLLAGAGLLTFILGAVWFIQGVKDIQAPPGMPLPIDTAATVLHEPMDLPQFQLTGTNGNAFTNNSLRGSWSFLFFGYTYCPDICPTTLAMLADTESQLQGKNVEHARRYVFVSVDPARDTIEHLGEYVTYFNPLFMGATGPEQEIQILTKPLGIRYQRSPEERPEGDYLIDHSAAILLIDPDGKLRALISPPHDAAVIAQDFQKITDYLSP